MQILEVGNRGIVVSLPRLKALNPALVTLMFPEDHRDEDACGDQTIPASGPVGGNIRHEGQREAREDAPPRGRLQPRDIVAGRFVIVRFLGAGGMGEVYEVEDRFLQGTHVALKAIVPESASIPGALVRFEREVLLARQITHPNVCPVYDIIRSLDTPGFPCFIAMKLLREETLATRLQRQGRLDSGEAVSILRQIAAALRAAHQANVLHRDLKPANIMLDGSGADVKAVVTDFGLAREYEPDMTAASGGYVLGTPGYIAPEILSGSRATPASDLYALGVVLHEMLMGRRPPTNPKTGHPTVSPELRTTNVPTFCATLIQACLNFDPSERNRGFEQAVQIVNPESSPLPAVYPTSGSLSRRWILGVGAGAALSVGGGLYWNWNSLDNLLHPLPSKRFVALMTWPVDTNKDTKPILSGVIDAIETVLSRAEAFDRNLFVISSRDVEGGAAAPTKLTQIRDSLGANLVLATSGVLGATHFRLLLRILDVSTNAVLRERNVVCALTEMTALPLQAVRAAAVLLSVSLDDQQYERARPAANSPAAYKAFEAAEELMTHPNFAGLDGAIQKYSDAVNQDPRYALAYSKLAFAYCALYDVKHDPTALELARNNGERALKLDSKLVDAHVALSTVYEQTGDRQLALEEVRQALLLDPGNVPTLNWQAGIYWRMNRWKEAEQTFRRMLALRPNNWLAYNQLGWLLSAQGKYPEAIGAFRSATVAAPRLAMAFNNLGALCLKVGDAQQATENFKKSLAIKEEGDTLAGAASALRAQGKYSEALLFARKAVSADPANDWNWGELGDCFSFLKREQKNAYESYFRAATEIERQLHTDHNDGPGWMRLALYRAKCNSHDVVLPIVAKAERLGASDLDSQLAKVRILEILGKRKDALTTVAEAMSRGMTRFEIAYTPDLQDLRNDPGYLRILNQDSAATKH